MVRPAIYGKGSAQSLNAFHHALKSIMAIFRKIGDGLESPAVILNEKVQRLRGELHLHLN
jgi:hypothetical protein